MNVFACTVRAESGVVAHSRAHRACCPLQALPVQTFLHADAHVDGGIAFVDKQLLESQRAAVLQLMKEVSCLQTLVQICVGTKPASVHRLARSC